MRDEATLWAAQAWARHQNDLRAFVGRMVPNGADVDDIVASTYEVLVRARGKARDIVDERLFVLGVGANVARHHARRQQRTRRLEEAVASQPLGDGSASVELQFEHRQIEADLAWAIGQLSPEQRSLILQLNDGASAAEVSRLLGEPEATVRSRAFHARKRLKKLLEQRWLIIAALALLMTAGYAAYRYFVTAKPVLPRPRTENPVPAVEKEAAVKVTPPARAKLPVKEPPRAVTRVNSAPPPTALELFEEANRAHFTAKNYAQAVEGWSRFLEAYPGAPLADDARYNRVVALFKLGQLGQAEEGAREALRQTPATAHRNELEKLIELIAGSNP